MRWVCSSWGWLRRLIVVGVVVVVAAADGIVVVVIVDVDGVAAAAVAVVAFVVVGVPFRSWAGQGVGQYHQMDHHHGCCGGMRWLSCLMMTVVGIICHSYYLHCYYHQDPFWGWGYWAC